MPESFNILHLSAVQGWGGGGNHIENLCYEFTKICPEVKNVIVVAEKGQFQERLEKSNFKFYTLPFFFKIDPRAIFKLIRICRKEKIDLVHIHGSNSLTLAVLADKFANLPPFIFSKKTSFPINRRKQTLYKYNYPKIRKILCVSEATKEISLTSIEDKEKLITIYHGTRIDNKSTTTPFLIREKFAIPKDYKLVGSIANHILAKDLDTWINTIDFIVNKLNYKQISFVQIGNFTNLTTALKERLENLGLDNYVHFLGFQSNASNFIPQFDALLHTSVQEGLPQVIYEAFYHKVPVVSTNVGGIPEVITDGLNGFLTKKRDAESLANKVMQILENHELASDFTQKSYDILLPKFTSENMARETLQVYKEIILDK